MTNEMSEAKKLLLPRMTDEFHVLSRAFAESPRLIGPEVLRAVDVLTSAFAAGSKLLICGNGGSAADSQHMAAEFVSSFNGSLSRRALPAVALTTDSSILTAFSNDFGFDGVFSRQIEALGRTGDCLIAISTSGASINVIRAAEQAKRQEMSVIALVGARPAQLSRVADIAICVPSENTQVIQTVHLAIEHFICGAVEAHFTGSEREL
jgi:D-sedoheptulose 7-phosphate isomerase